MLYIVFFDGVSTVEVVILLSAEFKIDIQVYVRTVCN